MGIVLMEKIIVAFSGGRTSAYMCWWLQENMSHLYDLHFVYANTGLEHEKTLKFVNLVDEYFRLDLVWLEAKISKEQGVGTGYIITDYSNATRDGKLFNQLCEAYGLPNKDYPHCTRELKNTPMTKYANDKIGKNTRIALGIRHDEFNRVKPRADAIYPLATIAKKTKQEILNWWSNQPFDLEIEEHYGNCVGCYKKNAKKLQKIANENPQYFDPFIEMEKKFASVKTKEENGDRQIYRYNRTAYEVKYNLKLPSECEIKDECAGECGSIISDFESKRAENRLF